jgi:hypothetical protein
MGGDSSSSAENEYLHVAYVSCLCVQLDKDSTNRKLLHGGAKIPGNRIVSGV